MNKLIALYIVALSALPSFAHAAGEAAKGGLPQFDPEWFASQIFWLAISFGILYMIFAKKTLPDISSVIENRKNHIQSDLETAEKLTAEADAVHDAYQENLNKAQSDAADAIKEVENKGKSSAERAMEQLRQKADAAILDTESKIEASKMAAMDDMNQIAAEAATHAVEKITGLKANKSKMETIVKNLNTSSKTTKSKAA